MLSDDSDDSESGGDVDEVANGSGTADVDSETVLLCVLVKGRKGLMESMTANKGALPLEVVAGVAVVVVVSVVSVVVVVPGLVNVRYRVCGS